MFADTIHIDCKGQQCPAPILAVAKAARAAQGPVWLEVEATDGDFPVDIEAWCRSTGARLEALEQGDGRIVARLAIGGPEAPPTEAPPPPRQAEPSGGTQRVDCVGMTCPAPILQVARAAQLADGPVVLEVLADDDDFPVDIEAWCRSTGATLFGLDPTEGAFLARIGLNGATDAPAPSAASDALDLRCLAASTALLKLGQAVLATPRVEVRIDSELQGPLHAWAAAIGAGVHLRETVDDSLLATVALGEAVPIAAPALAATPAPVPTPAPAPAPPPVAPVATGPARENKAVYLVLHNDFETLMAAMMVANASAAQGMEVEMFFSFWGVNVLRGEAPRPVEGTELAPRPPLLQRLMKWMMPAGPEAQTMSKMHMGGMGLGMMKHFMRQQNVLSLHDLMQQAVEQGVTFTVCTMSMGVMGIQKQDLMDLPNLRFGGVTSFTANARTAASSMVF